MTPLLPRYDSSEFFDWFDPSSALKYFDRGEEVFDDSLGDSWRLFEVFNRSSPRDWVSPIQLAVGVCGDAESDHKNCSEACSRQSDMFDSWVLIRHCLTLASLSLAGESFSGLEESSIDLVNDALHYFSVQDATEFPGELILNQTFECALASCQTDAGECRMKELNSSYIVDGRVHWNIMADSLTKMCEGIEVNVNSDVAGPGVLILYFIQMGKALYAWAYIVLPKIFNAMAAFTRFLGRILHSFGFKRGIIANRHSISKRLEKTNLAHATSTFLVEFHEAQCFFVISIEIALLYSGSRASSSGSTNRVALLLFSNLLSIFACVGAWPILLTQASLRRSHLDSFYYLTLSTVAMALAFATSHKAVYPDIDESHKLFAGQNMISECGNNTSLRSFCLTSGDTSIESIMLLSASGIRYLFLLISLFWFPKLLELSAKITWLHKKPKPATEQQRKATCLARGVLVGIAIIFFLATDGIAMAFIVYSLYDLHNIRLELDLGDWGVGQVIAVLVWAPVTSKYLYLIMFGVEKGFVYRLSRAFMVVKRPIGIESDDEEYTAPVPKPGVEPDGTPLMPVDRNTAGW
ncbi:hypothetical protein LCI18_007081 [Fusarium solani-melongenae]|uniref:Uncharacterized protein n=1 Tax=Fusarium solani subsp. cucurbitae TaxID=2747967 RepID=A0ACD3Z4L5_FUSSC|nr:hypothetical protein LCI18_007081 [Fusarium solani-melongenae]